MNLQPQQGKPPEGAIPIGKVTFDWLAKCDDPMFRVLVDMLVASHQIQKMPKMVAHLHRCVYIIPPESLGYYPGDEEPVQVEGI